MAQKKKKKMTITQFILIYIAILSLILLGISACSNEVNSGNTQVVETPDTPTEVITTSTIQNYIDTPEPIETPLKGALSGLKVCIDPGHQQTPPEGKETIAPWSSDTKLKNTHGATGISTKIEEYKTNLEIALKVRDTLEKEGAEVVMTREDNESTHISNQDRANIANNAGVNLTISIHCNSADSQNIAGIETYTRGSGDGTAEYKERSDKEFALSQKLLSSVAATTGAAARDAHKSDAYTGINFAKYPTFILECGFISNPDEDQKLNSAEYQQKIADGILSFLKDNKGSF